MKMERQMMGSTILKMTDHLGKLQVLMRIDTFVFKWYLFGFMHIILRLNFIFVIFQIRPI